MHFARVFFVAKLIQNAFTSNKHHVCSQIIPYKPIPVPFSVVNNDENIFKPIYCSIIAEFITCKVKVHGGHKTYGP